MTVLDKNDERSRIPQKKKRKERSSECGGGRNWKEGKKRGKRQIKKKKQNMDLFSLKNNKELNKVQAYR